MGKRSTAVPSHLIATPVAGPGLEFRDLVVEHYMEFGDSGGETVWWRPCASPSLSDPIYRNLRTPEMARRDRNAARRYSYACKRAGGADNFAREFYFELAKNEKIGHSERPVLLISSYPHCGTRVKMPICPDAFDTSTRKKQLACFLQQEFGASRMKGLAFDGVFDLDSIGSIQEHADHVAKVIEDSIAKDQGIPEQYWNSYLSLYGHTARPDPSENTIAVAWRRSGSIFLRTETNDVLDGEIEFPLDDGETTLQMRLIWRLLVEWPRGLRFEQIAEELHKKDYRKAIRNDDEKLMYKVAMRVRSLLHTIRSDKLQKSGINPDILPAVRRSDSRARIVRLQLYDLDRNRVGHLRRTPVVE